MDKLKSAYILGLVIMLLSTTVHASHGQHFSNEFGGTGTEPGTNIRSGKITFLRVASPKDGWGPAGRKVFAEVIVKLSTANGKAYGFQLRKNNHVAAYNAMFELLKDAFKYNWTVTIDVQEPKLSSNNPNGKPWNVGYILRVAVKK